jgi:hypothetical protein
MKVLLAIPHVFNPISGSPYSSQTESKRSTKQVALRGATIENLNRHSHKAWIHASLGKNQPIITREAKSDLGADITIQVYSPNYASLRDEKLNVPEIQWIDPGLKDYTLIPLAASRRLLEQAAEYDLVGYLEDDILIEDQELFSKILYLDRSTDGTYAFIPHRCEAIPGHGDVILSGDPDGGRPDLFWDTGEKISVSWPLGNIQFYRATNPHSGCYFLSRRQALRVADFWKARNWRPDFQLSGPLEQAGSGILLPIMKLMKPIPAHYRFLKVRHLDELWKRHPMETNEFNTKLRSGQAR